MQKSVLEYLDLTAEKYPNKIAFDDGKKTITFKQLENYANAIGTHLLQLDRTNKPIAVFLPKGCECVSSFLGIVASGNFYCPIDYDMPIDRINMILNVLQPIAIITKKESLEKAKVFLHSSHIVLFEDAIGENINEEQLDLIRSNSIDTDPLYVLFTSGSTGVPKGVVISHRSVIDYIDWVENTFSITSEDIFGNQAPFYFDNSVLDIYSGLKTGSTVVILPKRKMMFPAELVKYLNEKKITTIFWVPSLLCNIANLKIFDDIKPVYLKKILFAGEVMPNKQLNVWRNMLPNAVYANLYGPTEITVDCTYYIVDREFDDDEPLPIGKRCRNSRVLVLDENDMEVQVGCEGELCVVGTSLSLGYYNNPDKTRDVFVQNPLNSSYRELIYRTGDIVKYNEFGELIYLGRKDFQIKHMGHRVELGEIETAFIGIDDVDVCACIYDDEEVKIKMCYAGKEELDTSQLGSYMKQKVPSYMLPSEYIYFSALPYNANGKIDRKILKKQCKGIIDIVAKG